MGSITRQILTPYKQKQRYVPKHKKHEESVQLRVCSYLRQHLPDVDFHSDYAAGLKLTKNQAIIRKRLNSGRGWSDLFIPEPMTHTLPDGTQKTYNGLFLELKKSDITIYVTQGERKGELVANPQIIIEADFLKRMNKKGYFARFAVGYDKAVQLINWYFEIELPENAELF